MNNSEEGKIIKNFYYLVLIIITLYLTYILRDVLIPFVLGGLLAYALSPAVQFLNSRGFSWKISVLIVFVIILVFFLALFIFLVPEVISQFRTLTFQWSQYSESLIDKILEGIEKLDERYPDSNISQTIESFLTTISANLQNYLTHIISGIPNLVSILANIIFLGFIMTPVALYFFMADATKVRRSLVRMFPSSHRKEYVALFREIDQILGGFIRGRALIALFVGICATVGLALMNIDFALAIGVIAGIVEIVPYLGPVIGAIPAIILAATKSPWLVLGVALLFGGINFVEGIFISPNLLGKETGLHPLTVLFALAVGGKLYGALGIIIAIPVAGILKGLLSHYRKNKKLSSAS
ncbi:MAG: hypothetical protein PWP57_730 [Candidatus Atribacteria bacterium]|nr:hypothetical protein [Candidatus Atribacteria bacterium]